MLIILADIIAKKEKTSTGELYKFYNTAISRFEKREELKFLSERRILDLVNELDTMGLVTTWNVSKGKGGYGKEIRLNISAQSIVDFYEPDKKSSQK